MKLTVETSSSTLNDFQAQMHNEIKKVFLKIIENQFIPLRIKKGDNKNLWQ